MVTLIDSALNNSSFRRKRPATTMDLELEPGNNLFKICRKVSGWAVATVRGRTVAVVRTTAYMSLVKQIIIVKYIIES